MRDTLERGHGLLGGAHRLQRETITVEAVGGAAQTVVALPGNSLRPFVTALAIGSFLR